MVRLKATSTTEQIQDPKFQFHDGSIKGERDGIEEVEFVEFQFHDGSIKGGSHQNSPESSTFVSIPRWFD